MPPIYCRCVESKRLSNAKKKGENNRKNGNKYLGWAFIEAANFAIRYHDRIKRYYQRKRSRTNGIVAIKACAHKLARASYYVQRDQVTFDITPYCKPPAMPVRCREALPIRGKGMR